MAKFLVGCLIGLGLGSVGVVVAQQPGNPYSPGNWQSEQRLQYDLLDRSTDPYLLEQRLNERSLRSPCP